MAVLLSHSNYLASQAWNRPFHYANNEILQPLQLQEYNEIPNWNELPLFWKDREVVQIFEVDHNPKMQLLIPYTDGCDKMLVEISQMNRDGAVERVQALAAPLFKTNIAYFADLAAGRTPEPLKITHDLPPRDLLIPIKCQGISVRMNTRAGTEGWTVLTPLTTDEYRALGDRWDRLPLFRDPHGVIVRPYVFYDQSDNLLITESSEGEGPYFLMMPYEHDNPETRNKFHLRHNDQDQTLASKTIRLLYDQPINQEEEKN